MTVGVWRTLLQAAAFTALALGCGGMAAGAVQAQTPTAPSQPKGVPVPHEVSSRMQPLKAARSALVEFDIAAPFPYTGRAPSGKPFLDVTDEDGRRGHSTSRGVL